MSCSSSWRHCARFPHGRAHPACTNPAGTLCSVPNKAALPSASGSPALPDDGEVLRARNGVLEQRVDELTRALAASRQQLEQFEHGVSHDLRAPLRAINSFASLMDEALDANAQASARDYLGRIQAAAVRADELIDALLDLSRAGHSPLRLQPVDLSLLADWVLVELQDAEQGRAATVQVQPGLRVNGDERLLKQLLRQVLHNAWKFSDGGATTTIKVSGKRVGNRLQVQVRDAGSGFDMAYADKLFEPFQRLHGPEAGGGHGLGLAIAQRIAVRHGGDLRAQSTPGEGSVFYIELPVAETSG